MNPAATSDQIKHAIAACKSRHAIASRKAAALADLSAKLADKEILEAMGYTRPDQEEVLLSSVRYLLGLRLGPLAEVMRDEAAAEASALQEQIVALRRMLPGGILLARQVL